ncbi:hypothetical protein E4U13_002086 [Claviceps humidiphila]|uniref:Uncharacterized protein n=1 Tax=Claviceps humidiphila TaxID=1294629 RepID=A0A9P7TQQ0_9HYPO|nr:hypothetical protein E4U13_002086 [Claviceps humidiphila]
MYPGGPNPTQIQFIPPNRAIANPRPPPLVLLHDGGGTTFSYFLLGSLGRDVWAVHNSRYFTGDAWEGGMEQMVLVYLDGLVKEGIRGEIMLGGWSLGGFLSLAMAHQIAKNPERYPFSVAGLLLIDSPYHIARSKISQPHSKAPLGNVPDLVRTAFEHCDAMLQQWDLPRWSGTEGAQETDLEVSGGQRFKLQRSEVLYKPATGGAKTWSTIRTGTLTSTEVSTTEAPTTNVNVLNAASAPEDVVIPGSPPPAVLIRCTQFAKRSPEISSNYPCLVDLNRNEKLLGWEGRYPEFIKAVIDVDADHYRLFDRTHMERMEDVTARLAWGMDILDALWSSNKAKKGAKGD